jgi:hypothetical protein
LRGIGEGGGGAAAGLLVVSFGDRALGGAEDCWPGLLA